MVTLEGQNWPQWRGDEFNSVAKDQQVPVEFGKEKNLLWRIELPGSAGASPVVYGDKLFLTTVIGKESLGVVCVSTAGKKLWQYEFEKPNKNRRMDNASAASPSPVTDGEFVWAVMGTGELACLTVGGDLVWRKDLPAEYGKFDLSFGYTSSPVLSNGKLVVMVVDGDRKDPKQTSVGRIICLDAKTGEEAWLHQRKTDGTSENMHSYASPAIYRDGDLELLLIHGADYLTAHRLGDGQEVWRFGGLNPQGKKYHPTLRFVSSPGVGDKTIIVPTAKNGPVVCIKPDGSGDVTNDDGVKVWRLPKGTPDVSTPLVYRGIVYLATEKGLLVALDAATGKQLYRERLMADKQRSTPVACDGKVYLVGRDGTVAVVKAGSEFMVLAKNKLGEEATSSPAIAKNVIYIRTWKALYAFANAGK